MMLEAFMVLVMIGSAIGFAVMVVVQIIDTISLRRKMRNWKIKADA